MSYRRIKVHYDWEHHGRGGKTLILEVPNAIAESLYDKLSHLVGFKVSSIAMGVGEAELREDWKQAVAGDNTRLGFEDWKETQNG